jgi:hypothetical protein
MQQIIDNNSLLLGFVMILQKRILSNIWKGFFLDVQFSVLPTREG